MKDRKYAALAAALALTLALAACSPGAQEGSGSSGASPSPESSSTAAPPDGSSGEGSASSSEEEAGKLLGEFTTTDLEGNAVDQSIFAGYDVTMVNIWATFCGPCLREMPDLGALHEEYKDKSFQIVGIVTDTLNQDGTISDSQVEVAKEVVEKTGAAYPHLLPSEDLINLVLWQVNSVPTTIFVNKEGALVGKGYLGSRDADAWRKIIDEKLAAVQEAAQ